MDEEPTGADAGWRLTKEKKKKGGNVKGVHAVLLLSPTTGGIVLPPTARGTAGSLFFLFWAAFTFALFGHDFFLFLSSSSLFRFLFLLLHSNPRLAYLPTFFFYFSLSLLLLLFLFFSKCSRGHSHHSPNVRGTLALVVYVWSYQEPLQVCTGNKKKREREEGLVAFSFKFKNSFVPFFFILFFFFLFPPLSQGSLARCDRRYKSVRDVVV